MIRGMSTALWLDFLGVRLDTSKAEDKHFIINFITPDNGEKYLVELSNSTLTNIEGIQSPKADLTITMNRSELNDVMMGKTSFDDKIKEGKAKLKGNRKPYDELKNMLTTFTMVFELLPGTLPDAAAAPAKVNPFKQDTPADSSGG
jgi:alkyl sulfatase BDS1-like metallo-beta-lactamase superfamily hydrolase